MNAYGFISRSLVGAGEDVVRLIELLRYRSLKIYITLMCCRRETCWGEVVDFGANTQVWRTSVGQFGFINLRETKSSIRACFTERSDPLKLPWYESIV